MTPQFAASPTSAFASAIADCNLCKRSIIGPIWAPLIAMRAQTLRSTIGGWPFNPRTSAKLKVTIPWDAFSAAKSCANTVCTPGFSSVGSAGSVIAGSPSSEIAGYASGAGQTSLSEQVAQTSRSTVSACAFASINDGMTERRISTFGLEAPTRFRSRAIDFEHRPGAAVRSMETSNTISGVGSGMDPVIVASPTNDVHRVTQLTGESIATISKPLFGQRVGNNQYAAVPRQASTPNQTGATA